MLDLFKKKEAVKPEVKSPNPSNLDAGQVFETGKEVQFKDPKTGEFVYQRAISSEQRQEIMIAMQKNAQLANKFMDASRKMIAFQELMEVAHKEIIASEKEINDTVGRVRDDMKLDRRWGFNFALGVLERRDPPSG